MRVSGFLSMLAVATLTTALAPAGDPKVKPILPIGHTRKVTSVALSADGKKVVTGSYDKTAILWEAASGKKLQTFNGHPGEKDKADRAAELRAIKKELAELTAQMAVKEKELADLRKTGLPRLPVTLLSCRPPPPRC
jgi:hypothetical protein